MLRVHCLHWPIPSQHDLSETESFRGGRNHRPKSDVQCLVVLAQPATQPRTVSHHRPDIQHGAIRTRNSPPRYSADAVRAFVRKAAVSSPHPPFMWEPGPASEAHESDVLRHGPGPTGSEGSEFSRSLLRDEIHCFIQSPPSVLTWPKGRTGKRRCSRRASTVARGDLGRRCRPTSSCRGKENVTTPRPFFCTFRPSP